MTFRVKHFNMLQFLEDPHHFIFVFPSGVDLFCSLSEEAPGLML